MIGMLMKNIFSLHVSLYVCFGDVLNVTLFFVGPLFWEMYGINMLGVIKIKRAFPKGGIEKKLFLCKERKFLKTKCLLEFKSMTFFYWLVLVISLGGDIQIL
jgi:hypothetical protein